MSIYDYTVLDNKENEVSLSIYKNKVLLIVNTATKCGFTPQYKDLEELYLKYKDRGLEILDFPCNQFGKQAPGNNDEIAQFCELKYKTTFQTFDKIDVNGQNEAPLFKYLKEQKGGFLTRSIKWNFTKFLVDRAGNVIDRFSPITKPSSIDKYIEQLL